MGLGLVSTGSTRSSSQITDVKVNRRPIATTHFIFGTKPAGLITSFIYGAVWFESLFKWSGHYIIQIIKKAFLKDLQNRQERTGRLAHKRTITPALTDKQQANHIHIAGLYQLKRSKNDDLKMCVKSRYVCVCGMI
jgi:hypothetical protein